MENNMEISLLQELVGSLGFPIAMVVYFIWDKNKTMLPMIEAIRNNTLVLNRLLMKMDQEELLGDVNE